MLRLIVALVLLALGGSTASAITIPNQALQNLNLTIRYSPGGYIDEFAHRFQRIAARGEPVYVVGGCNSACTLVMSYVPASRVCFGPRGYLGFHMAYTIQGRRRVPSPAITQQMVNTYPAPIRAWIEARGGVRRMTIQNMWILRAPQLWAMGYRRC